MSAESLFQAFSPLSFEDWKAQVLKDLKLHDISSLSWETDSGIILQPYFTETKVENPISAANSDWKICSEICVNKETEANAIALSELEGGINSLSFHLENRIPDLKLLLKEVITSIIELNFHLHSETPINEFVNQLHLYTSSGFVYLDPIHELASGTLTKENYAPFLSSWTHSLNLFPEQFNVGIDATHFQECGLNSVTELACTLAHLNEYLTLAVDFPVLMNKLQKARIKITVGPMFFSEISKLRALRLLINQLFHSYGLNEQISIHTINARWNKTTADSNNNIVRISSEALSAAIGCADVISILPFDSFYTQSNAFSRRIARNQHHLLKEESYLNKVSDVSAGSYYIEHYTNEIATKAWEDFKKIESNGGLLEMLNNGSLTQMAEQQANSLIHTFKSGNKTLIGVNKFKNPTIESPETLRLLIEKKALLKPINLEIELTKVHA